MTENRWIIVYGKYEGLEKKALNLLNASIFDLYKTPISCFSADEVEEYLLKECNTILVGTAENNKIIDRIIKSSELDVPKRAQGYSASVKTSVWNKDKDMMVVCGYDDAGVLYGCVDIINKYLGSIIYNPSDPKTYLFTSHKAFFTNPFTVRCPEWKQVSSPSVETRGVWTWGHVIYDYKAFFENMVLLKLNEIVIWNDYAPINANDIVDYAHSLGIKVIWGFAWGWDTNCNVSMGMDDDSVKKLSNDILAKYEKEYARIKGDGIYFQSATELDTEYINGKLIAETVVELVNITSDKILGKYPDLFIQFGLHANSVKNRLDYIKKVDPRIKIVWENCGPAFPFADHSGRNITIKPEDFNNTFEFTEKISQLRSVDDSFGLVLKEMTFLDWSQFEHIEKNFILGEKTERFMQDRLKEKRKIWRFSQVNWIENLKYMQKTIKRVVELRKENNVQAVIEDGLFEKEISLPAALYAETLWDCEKDSEETLKTVCQFPCVKFTNI